MYVNIGWFAVPIVVATVALSVWLEHRDGDNAPVHYLLGLAAGGIGIGLIWLGYPR